MTALVCLVAAMPAMLPLDWQHQATIGSAALASLLALSAIGLPSSLPLPYLAIALGSVVLISALAATRWSVRR